VVKNEDRWLTLDTEHHTKKSLLFETPSMKRCVNRRRPPLQDEVNAFDDLIWGVTGIAAEIKRTERQTYHLIQIGAIPTKKVGAIHTARKSKLRARLLGEDQPASTNGGPAAANS
jgi:hypothetical protein